MLVDVGLAHLDRPFDYAVPAALDDAARPGVRVKVRFAGQDVDGFLVARAARSDHAGSLTPLRRVVSPEPVLSPAVAELAGAVAARYAGVRSDVLRLAVPPRHATVEKQAPLAPDDTPAWDDATMAAAEAAWADYGTGAAFLHHLRDGGAPRAVWTAAPGETWPRLLAQAAAAVRAGGRGALLCLPDVKDVARVDAALTELLGPGHHVTLTADVGPAARYRDFLAVSRGARRIVVGTRAAAFAPVHDLGLVVVWDDGDDLHAEPRAPYPHVRETLLLRAEQEGTAFLAGGFARSVEADHLVRTGWAQRDRRPPQRPAGPGDGRDHRSHRARPAPRPPRRRGPDPLPGAHAAARRPRPRPGAGPDAARGLRAGAGLRALPHPGALRPLRGAAGAHQRHHAAGLPVVRTAGRELVVLRVRRPRPARAGAR